MAFRGKEYNGKTVSEYAAMSPDEQTAHYATLSPADQAAITRAHSKHMSKTVTSPTAKKAQQVATTARNQTNAAMDTVMRMIDEAGAGSQRIQVEYQQSAGDPWESELVPGPDVEGAEPFRDYVFNKRGRKMVISTPGPDTRSASLTTPDTARSFQGTYGGAAQLPHHRSQVSMSHVLGYEADPYVLPQAAEARFAETEERIKGRVNDAIGEVQEEVYPGVSKAEYFRLPATLRKMLHAMDEGLMEPRHVRAAHEMLRNAGVGKNDTYSNWILDVANESANRTLSMQRAVNRGREAGYSLVPSVEAMRRNDTDYTNPEPELLNAESGFSMAHGGGSGSRWKNWSGQIPRDEQAHVLDIRPHPDQDVALAGLTNVSGWSDSVLSGDPHGAYLASKQAGLLDYNPPPGATAADGRRAAVAAMASHPIFQEMMRDSASKETPTTANPDDHNFLTRMAKEHGLVDDAGKVDAGSFVWIQHHSALRTNDHINFRRRTDVLRAATKYGAYPKNPTPIQAPSIAETAFKANALEIIKAGIDSFSRSNAATHAFGPSGNREAEVGVSGAIDATNARSARTAGQAVPMQQLNESVRRGE